MTATPDDSLILNALIQAGISKSRASLTSAEIDAALAMFDPTKPVFGGKRGASTAKPVCPHGCIGARVVVVTRARTKELYLCRGCSKRWSMVVRYED